MKFYFKRFQGGTITKAQLYSYEGFIAGFFSFLFTGIDHPRTIEMANLLVRLFMAICMVSTAIVIYQEYKKESSCNVFYLLRLAAALLLIVLSFTGIDFL